LRTQQLNEELNRTLISLWFQAAPASCCYLLARVAIRKNAGGTPALLYDPQFLMQIIVFAKTL